ncbi:MAG: 50S ribosomal protein L4 [Candidatus Mariimomonas ferrooxydans]
MAQLEILNKDNKPVGKVDLPSDIFGVEVKKCVLHEVVRNYLANQRQGNVVTKTRGLVSGGGRKPYKQKGTGRARAGSNRSPLWKGGGTVFGPLPRDYSYKLPKKVKWAALGAAFSAKFADGAIVVIEDLPLSEPKTKDLVALIKGLGLSNVLIILSEDNKTIRLSARNIPNVDVATVGRLNVYEVLVHEKLLMTRGAVERMKEVYLD